MIGLTLTLLALGTLAYGNNMKRIDKAVLLLVRTIAYRGHYERAYYKAQMRLYELRMVHVMPLIYYKCLYRICIRLIESNKFQRLADRAIHTIPYDVRFNLA